MGTSLLGQSFKIDAGHTSVVSKVQRFAMVDVVGRFNEVSGEITYNDDHVKIAANVSIGTSSYSSNNPAGEDAVKSQVFLDAANYPTIEFKSSNVEKRGDKLWMIGDLTIHGTTKEVEFPFELLEPTKDPTGTTTLAVFATLVINRQDYGIAFSRKLPNGKEFIGNEVKIELNVLAAQG